MPKCKDCKDFGRGECAAAGADDYICGAFKPETVTRYADGKPVHDAVKQECSTCFWFNETCNNKKSCCYGEYKENTNFCGWLEFAKEQTNTELVHDAVNHPAHYTAGGIECIDALESATEGLTGIEAVCTANAIKYLWRWKRKNGTEDLCKAVWYIERLINRLERSK